MHLSPLLLGLCCCGLARICAQGQAMLRSVTNSWIYYWIPTCLTVPSPTAHVPRRCIACTRRPMSNDYIYPLAWSLWCWVLSRCLLLGTAAVVGFECCYLLCHGISIVSKTPKNSYSLTQNCGYPATETAMKTLSMGTTPSHMCMRSVSRSRSGISANSYYIHLYIICKPYIAVSIK